MNEKSEYPQDREDREAVDEMISGMTRPLLEVVTHRGGDSKIIKGKQSSEPLEGLFQGFSASGPDVWVKTAAYSQPGVVVSAVGARCGKTFLAEGDWTPIANTHALLPNEELDVRWLWYRTNAEDFWIKGGSAQPFVKVKATLERPAHIPPLREQKRIVAVLDEAFEGVATAAAHAERNLQNARELFQSVLQSTFEQKGEGWVETTLSEACELLGGSQPPKKHFIYEPQEGYVRLVQIRDFRTDKFATYIPESLANRNCEKDDILIGRYGASVGQIHTGLSGSYNVALIKAVPNAAILNRWYFFRFLQSGMFQDTLMAVASRSAQNGFNKTDIAGFRVPVPPFSVQEAIVQKLDALDAEARRLEAIYERKLAALEELKQSLLQQAFSGKL